MPSAYTRMQRCGWSMAAPSGLHLAAFEGRLADVRRLVSQDPHGINERTDRGDTPLHLAAAHHPTVVSFLLSHHADPNLADGDQCTPLHVACRSPSLECVQLLIGGRAEPNAVSVQGETCLDAAEDRRQVDSSPARLLHDLSLAPLLCAEVSIVDGPHAGADGVVFGFDQLTRHGRQEYLVALLDGSVVARAGAASLERRGRECSPARHGGWAFVSALSASCAPMAHDTPSMPPSSGVDRASQEAVPQASSWRLLEPLVAALSFTHERRGLGMSAGHCHGCARTRLRSSFRVHRRAPTPPSGGASGSAYHHAVSKFLQRAWDRERSPLHAAAAMGHVALVRRLLASGVAVDASTGSGAETALHLAAGSGVSATVAVLLDAGACINAANLDGDSPLHVAAWEGDQATLQLLIERGAAIDAPGHAGERPITVAAMRSQVEAVRLLLSYDADVNAADERGTPPALAATRHGAPRSILRLLDYDSTDDPDRAAERRRAGAAAHVRAAETADGMAALTECWQKRGRELQPHSRRLLLHGEDAAGVPHCDQACRYMFRDAANEGQPRVMSFAPASRISPTLPCTAPVPPPPHKATLASSIAHVCVACVAPTPTSTYLRVCSACCLRSGARGGCADGGDVDQPGLRPAREVAAGNRDSARAIGRVDASCTRGAQPWCVRCAPERGRHARHRHARHRRQLTKRGLADERGRAARGHRRRGGAVPIPLAAAIPLQRPLHARRDLTPTTRRTDTGLCAALLCGRWR